MSEIDAAEQARLREIAQKASQRDWLSSGQLVAHGMREPDAEFVFSFNPPTALAIINELEKARGEAKEAWAGVRVRDETINVTVKKRTAERDSARALLAWNIGLSIFSQLR